MPTLKEQIAALINDNTSGDISPKDVRDSFDLHIDDVERKLHHTVHHTYVDQAAMIADSANQLVGEVILIHGNPLEDGEYVAKVTHPSDINGYDKIGGLAAKHIHVGQDVSVHIDHTSMTLQEYINGHHIRFDTIRLLPDHGLSAGDLRKLETGMSYSFPAVPSESSPGAGDLIGFSKMEIAGITITGHRYSNALLIRTGPQTWTAYAEEWTGTDRQPTVEWNLDLDPLWPDSTGIGGSGATAFTGAIGDLVSEIGDASLFGAHTLVEKIRDNEVKLNVVSTRVATMEGFAGHLHNDIAPDFYLHVNNQGPHYLIINDRPTDTDHIGKDLFDGHEHKISLKWDTATPYTPAAPFNPTHFEEPASSGHYLDWSATGATPSVWIMNGTLFKHLIDPLTKAVFAYPAVHDLTEGQQVLTVKWNGTDSQLEVLKIEEATVHHDSSPDHMPLQKGGTVTAKALPFEPLTPAEITAVENNSSFLDAADKLLKWKNFQGDIGVIDVSYIPAWVDMVTKIEVGGAVTGIEQYKTVLITFSQDVEEIGRDVRTLFGLVLDGHSHNKATGAGEWYTANVFKVVFDVTVTATDTPVLHYDPNEVGDISTQIVKKDTSLAKVYQKRFSKPVTYLP